MSTVKIGNKKAFLLSPDTFVDGVFIDKLLESGTLNSGSATYTNWEYTATQDCIVAVNTGKLSNKSITIYINNKSLINYGTGWTFDSIMTPIQVKKGQTYKIVNLGNYANYYVYGIQRGSASENIGTVRELTYAEYNALSESEKMNGTEYYIKDINGDGQDFQPVIYSLDEREIGVWTDGKPLYQKTVSFGAIPNNTSKNVAHNISNLDNIISFDGVMFSSDSFETVPSGENSNFRLTANDTNINIVTSANWTDWADSYITLRYTKTTDTAGSGTWTPQGVPAVHYSTDEHVVGTWIDGSTIYEKVQHFQNVTFDSNGEIRLDFSSLNADLIIADSDSSFYIFTYQSSDVKRMFTNIVVEEPYIYVYGVAGRNITDGYVTVRYTKSS